MLAVDTTDGLCRCGCGELTTIAPRNDRERGWIKGRPIRFIKGHHVRLAEYKAQLFTPERNRKISKAHADGRIPSPTPRTGDRNPSWKGDDVGYQSLHDYLARAYPKQGVCEECGASGRTDYAFMHHPASHTRSREDYREMCRSCHHKMDGTNNFPSWLGRNHTEETRAKMRVSALKVWEGRRA